MMASCFKFAVIRISTGGVRDERINIGAAVITEAGLDIHLTRRLDRVRALSAAIDVSAVRELIGSMRAMDEALRGSGVDDASERLTLLSRSGPLSFSELGSFDADHDAYDTRVSMIMRNMVEPEPAPVRIREKRSRLLTQMKKAFREERVLALRGEDLSSHRIVAGYQMDEGLIADLVLKNGALHVVETVDASGETESPRSALGDIGISALVLERARMLFGLKKTETRLVYTASAALERLATPSLQAAAHQGAKLTNWASADDRGRFVHAISSLADPIPRKRRGAAVNDPRQIRFG